MAHDVFISHSSRDKPVSDAVCAALENAGVRCWMAPRDVQPGRSFAGEITRAIQQSKAMVLIFSANSNNSSQVLREVQLAVDSQLHILQFRIEDVLLNDDLKYYLSTPHWLDAMTPPLEGHLHRLAGSLKTLLGKAEAPPPPSKSPPDSFAVAPPPEFSPHSPPPAAPPPGPPRPNRWEAGFMLVVLASAALVLWLLGKAILAPQSESSSAASPVTSAATSPAPSTPSMAATKIDFSDMPDGFLEEAAFAPRGIRALKTFGGRAAINDADPGMVLPRNYTQVLNVRGNSPQTSLVFEFDAAIRSFTLTRIGGNPTSLPTWTLEAYDSSGRIVDTVTQVRGDTNEPRIRAPATFTVRGSAIWSVALAVDNRHGSGTWATYNCLPLVEIEFEH